MLKNHVQLVLKTLLINEYLGRLGSTLFFSLVITGRPRF